MERYEDFVARLRARKAEVWADILANEPPGRPVGRRPRDPQKEALLLELDRYRVERSELLARARRVPVDRGEPCDSDGPGGADERPSDAKV